MKDWHQAVRGMDMENRRLPRHDEPNAYVDHNWYDCLRCGYPQNPPEGYKGATCTCDTTPTAHDRTKDLVGPRGARGPRHGEPGAYPDFLEPDSLIEVIQAGPRGGYTKGDEKDEGESPTGDGSTQHQDSGPPNPIVDYLRSWYTRQGVLHDEWIVRRHWAVRWLGRWTLKTLVFVAAASWSAMGLIGRFIMEVVVPAPQKHWNGKRRRASSGRFPRNSSRHKDRRNDDYGLEE